MPEIDNHQKIDSGNLEANKIKIYKTIGLLRSNWPYFILSVIVCVSITKFYIATLSPLYMISSKLVFFSNERKTDNGDPMMKGLGLVSRQNNIEEEIEILNNTAVSPEIIKELNLNISYYASSRFNTSELYDKNAPFGLEFVNFNSDTIKTVFALLAKPVGNNIMELNGSGFHWKGKYGDTINFYFGRAVLTRNDLAPIDPKLKYKIRITDYESAAEKYKRQFDVSLSGKMSSILNLSFKETFPNRGEAILAKIIKTYIHNNIQQRNAIADSTISFINERLIIMGDQLSSIETEIRDYKTKNDLYDIQGQSSLWLKNSAEVRLALKEREVSLSVVEMLLNQVKNHPNAPVPVSFLPDDETFNDIASKIKTLESERLSKLNSITTKNPFVVDIDAHIEFEKKEMLKYLEAKSNEIKLEIKELNDNERSMNKQLRDVPEKQRIFLDYSRKQGILQELYVFLLKNREQTAINKSSNVSSITVINKVKSEKSF